jgi:PAS domain S-box-containing protein
MCSKSDTPVRVLLVEDNPGDSRLLRELLRDMEGPRFDLDIAPRLSSALERLSAASYGIVLLDLALPDGRGIEMLDQLRACRADVPIIVLTDVHEETTAVQALRAGAQDCLAKDHADRHTLLRAVRFAMERTQTQRLAGGRTENEESRLQGEELYRTLHEAATDFVWSCRPDGTIDYVNRRWREYTGLSLEQLTLEQWEGLNHPDDLPKLRACWQTATRTGEPFETEFRYRGKDGEYRWFWGRAAPLRDAGGQIVKWTGASTDITRRKQAEEKILNTQSQLERHMEQRTEELRASEERYRRIVDTAQEGVWVLDPKGKTTYVNRRIAEMLGHNPEEMLGRPLLDFMEEQARVDAGAHFAQRQHGPRQHRDFCFRKKDGTRLWTICSTSPLQGKSGEPVGLLCMVTDITERKQAEEALIKAKQAAEDATAAKSVFLATMSHEIRTPLNGVVGMADLLLGTTLDDRQRRYAQIVKASANQLASLINDILDFSKIEANRMELENVNFDLFAMVEDLADTFVQRAAQKRLELGCHLHAQLPEGVVGDAAKLRQVLSNLVGNALKFTEQGHVIVEGKLESKTADHSLVRFTVSDTGPGIGSDHLARLFQPFYQVDASTTRQYGGSGLGLAICKKLVEMMGGQITVHSESGRGSDFSFTVLLGRQPPPKGDPLLARVPAHLREARTLVVDDSTVIRRLLEEQLSSWGLGVQTVADSRQAMELLHEAAALSKPFKLVILADDLPDVSGLELARTIKGSDSLAPTALVLLISMEQNPDAGQLKEIGVAGSVVWPVRASRLLEVVMQALPAEEPPRNATAEEDPALPRGRERRTRILLAEDNEINQVVAAEILMRAGYQCQVVSSGKQAVEAVMRSKYDLLLMDCQMPQMDGFEATQLIRQQEHEARDASQPAGHLPIIALTAEAVKGDRERCLDAGMDGYVSKPIDADRLIAMIESFLRPAAAPTGKNALADRSRDMAPPLDPAALLARCMGNRALARKALEKFSRQAAGYLEELREASAKGDLKRVARVAHRVKGVAANLSANAVYQIAAELERVDQVKPSGRFGRFLSQLETEIQRCRACLPRAIAEMGEPQPENRSGG